MFMACLVSAAMIAESGEYLGGTVWSEGYPPGLMGTCGCSGEGDKASFNNRWTLTNN